MSLATPAIPRSGSAWQATARIPGPSLQPLEGAASADVCILGAGFTGLSAAHHLLEQGVPCVVLEANDIGFGASGATGGMAVPRYKAGFAALARTYGDETAARLHGLIHEAIDTLEALVRSHGLECRFARHGHITAAHGREAMASLEADAAWLASRVGDRAPVLFDQRQMEERTGTRAYLGGYFDPRGAGIHPLEYVRGLAASLSAKGARVHVDSPARSLTPTADRAFEVRTPRGSVRSRAVIVATNAYSGFLPPGLDLARRVVPVASSVIATAPLAREEIGRVLPQGNLLTDTRKLTNYFRRLPGERLLFGGRGDLLGRDLPESFKGLEMLLGETFPHLRAAPIAHRWSGKVAVTLDNFPHLGTLRPGIHFAMGYGGRGVALSHLLGKLVAKLALGGDVDAGPMTDGRFEPIPFHSMRVPGMHAMAKYYQWCDLRSTRR